MDTFIVWIWLRSVVTGSTVKNGVFWDVAPCVALLRTDGSKERSASFIRVTRIGELGTFAVTNNRRTLRRNASW
jgi:hypothetical protein